MNGLKSNIFLDILILFGSIGVLYLILLFAYLSIAGIIDFLKVGIT